MINAVPEIQRVLVVTKASLKLNIFREIKKWLVRPLSVGIASPSWFPATNIVVINYELLDRYRKRLVEPWDLCIVDECHNATNPNALRTDALRMVRARRRIGMTGSPLKNRLTELFVILNWIDPERFPCALRLQARFGKDLFGLSKMLRTVMIRRLKSDVMKDLPFLFRQVIEIPHDLAVVRQELAAYEKARTLSEQLKTLTDEAKLSGNAEEYSDRIMELRDTVQVAYAELSRFRRLCAIAKVPYATEHIRNCLSQGVNKLFVTGHHREALEAYHHAFRESVLFYGGMDNKRKDASVDRFMNDPSTKILFGSLRASGEGLNLTCCSHHVATEFDWTPVSLDQAEARLHRIGAKANILSQLFVFENSLDARMAQVCVTKRELADAVLDRKAQ